MEGFIHEIHILIETIPTPPTPTYPSPIPFYAVLKPVSYYTQLPLEQSHYMRYFLRVHTFTPIPALTFEIDWLPTKYRR